MPGCYRFNSNYIDNINSIDCNNFTSSKILNKKDAICYALSVEGVREGIEKADSHDVNFFWDLKTRKDNNKWFINIHSRKVLPSYNCYVGFTVKGEKLEGKDYFSECSYNK